MISLLPGLTIALTVGAAASFVAETYGGPVMLLALLLGIALNFVSEGPRVQPGVSFASKRVLRVGVALLGARIAFDDVLALGSATIELVASGVVITTLTGVLLARFVHRRSRFGVLIGGSTAICGASAALALSSVLPARPDGERETIFTVVAVTTLSTIAMVAYPVLFRALGFDEAQTGILIGATIHDVAQVVGAGYAVSESTGDAATIVKLFRVALLIPAVLIVSLIFRAERQSAAGGLPVPLFVLAFAGFVAINSVGLLHEDVRAILAEISRWCLITAVAAIGLTTSLKDIAQIGFQPVFVAVGCTLALLLYSIGGMLAFGI